MHSNTSLYQALYQTMTQINEQLHQVSIDALAVGIDPKAYRLPDGSYPLISLLLAKTEALNGMALLKTNQTTLIKNDPKKR